MQNNESNSAKSVHGHSLNKKLQTLLAKLLEENKIKNFQPEPRYNHPLTKQKQFSPDGEITLLNGQIIVYDNTTTIRHDRLKQKLWDAYGTKKYFQAQNIEIKYFVIIPNRMSAKELKHALREKTKLSNPDYFSTIDDIITVEELLGIVVL